MALNHSLNFSTLRKDRLTVTSNENAKVIIFWGDMKWAMQYQ